MRVTVRTAGTVLMEKHFHDEMVPIGSQQGCKLRLPDISVGRQHAVILPRDGSWILSPTNEEHVIHINKRRVTGDRPLLNGDVIEIAAYEIDIDLSEEARSKARSSDLSQSAGSATPEMHSGDRATTEATRKAIAQVPPDTHVKLFTAPMTVSKDHGQVLAELASGLASVEALAQLINRVLDTCFRQFLAERCYIGLRLEADGPLQLEEGKTRGNAACDVPAHARDLIPAVMDRRSRLLRGLSDSRKPNVVCVPVTNGVNCHGVLFVEAGGRTLGEEDLDFAAMLGQVTGAFLVRIGQQLDQTRTSGQASRLQGVRDAQRILAPAGLPQLPKLSVACLREHGTRYATDLFDVLKLTSGQLACMLAVVQAEAGRAAIFGQLRSAFRLGCVHNDPPHAILRQMNWLLCSQREASGRADCLVIRLDPGSGLLSYSTAGEPLGWLLSDGSASELTSQSQPALATDGKTTYGSLECHVGGGAAVLLCSPGLARSPVGPNAVMGMPAILRHCLDTLGEPSSDILRELSQDLSRLGESLPREQDATAILVQRSG